MYSHIAEIIRGDNGYKANKFGEPVFPAEAVKILESRKKCLELPNPSFTGEIFLGIVTLPYKRKRLLPFDEFPTKLHYMLKFSRGEIEYSGNTKSLKGPNLKPDVIFEEKYKIYFRLCRGCNIIFSTEDNRQHYHNANCRIKKNNQKRTPLPIIEKICPVCQRIFQTSRSDKKSCSNACRMALSRKKRD
jgi:hypothetical protein